MIVGTCGRIQTENKCIERYNAGFVLWASFFLAQKSRGLHNAFTVPVVVASTRALGVSIHIFGKLIVRASSNCLLQSAFSRDDHAFFFGLISDLVYLAASVFTI